MKKKILFVLLISIAIGISCNKIENPYTVENQISSSMGPNDFPPVNPEQRYRKVLVEEFTGHKCTYCPDGHRMLETLQAIYGDTMIVIGIHPATNMALPEIDPEAEYPYNFVTTKGDKLYQDFSKPALPSALINRTSYNSAPVKAYSKEDWQTAIRQRDKTVFADLQLINQFDNAKNELTANAKITLLQDYINPIAIVFEIIEDSIIKPQLNRGVRIENYQHNHVLRAVMTPDIYGTLLNGIGVLTKDSSCVVACKQSFKGVDWVKNKCHVTAFLLDRSTGVILQAETAEIE